MYTFINKWHKKIGIAVALFVVLLVISGIALNHSHGLNLNNNFIKSEWLLDLYNINPDSEPIGFVIDNNWATQVGDRIYFNDFEISSDAKQLFGLIMSNRIYVVAFDGKLALFTEDGELIEQLTGAEGVPAGMRAIGLSDQGDVIIRAAHGFYHVDLDELEWEEFDQLDASWSETRQIPNELHQRLLKIYRGRGLTLERVLLDFHSGRIVGNWGVYVVDLIAILFLLLALSGCWMWWKRR